ncbi:MAG: tetratricopeptide repeat protein [bacterium]|nr:tetratricopeptide repeat protein [bacterium]
MISSQLLADNCNDTITAAELLLAAGNIDEAIAIVEQSACHQDYVFVMNSGHLFYENELFDDAVTYYKIAVDLSEGNKDAQLLLGWSEYYAGNYWQALDSFQSVLKLDPENQSALQGVDLALAKKSSRNRVGNYVTSHIYSNDFYKKSAIGLTSNILFTTWSDLSVGVTQRRTVYDIYTPDEMNFAPDNLPSTMIQQEYWLSLGKYGQNGSVRVVGGKYENDSTWNEEGSVVGIEIARHNTKMSAIISDYDDGVYSQYNFQTAAAVGANSVATVFLSCQDASRKPAWSLGASLHYSSGKWAADISARGGNEIRPVYLKDLSVYNIKQEIHSSCSIDFSRQLPLGVVFVGGECQTIYSPESTMWQYDTLEYETFPASEGNLWLMTIGFSFEI